MNKTFEQLEKGDKIYTVNTNLPKLSISELLILKIQGRNNVGYPLSYFSVMPMNGDIKDITTETFYKHNIKKENSYMGGGIYWHTSEEAARNTIKNTIKDRIKRKRELIKESKSLIENYKQLLKTYEA